MFLGEAVGVVSSGRESCWVCGILAGRSAEWCVSAEWGRKVVAGVVYWDGVWRAVFEANILANVRVWRSAAVVGL